jgi:CubicO group peptidase (beta-lactamase class C family)
MGPETLHDVRSTTKSIVALVAGSVLARHPEYGVHSRIKDFPELSEKAPKWAQTLELRDFLNMSSGLAWKEWGHGFLTSDESRLVWKKDPVGYSLRRPLKDDPGTVFNYSGGSTFVVSRMLELIDGRSIAEIVRTDLFEPLGIVSWNWGKGWNGYYLPNAGIGLRSRDMLKIGELILAHGSWNGRQIIPAVWVDEMTSPLIRVQTDFFDLDEQGTMYGYFWWNGNIDLLGEKIHWYSTVGNGGQKIFIVPSLALIVIMTGGDYGSARMQIWETELLKRLLASVTRQ